MSSRSTLYWVPQQSRGFSLLEVMVAIAILGIAVVAVFQLFAGTLRSTKKSDDYSRALLYARSMLDEAYCGLDVSTGTDSVKFGNDFTGKREITLLSTSDENKIKLYEITVTITWPPAGNIRLKGVRTVYEPEK